MRFRFSMACPAAPLTRLSIAETITVLFPDVATPRWHPFVLTTPWRSGKTSFRKEFHELANPRTGPPSRLARNIRRSAGTQSCSEFHE